MEENSGERNVAVVTFSETYVAVYRQRTTADSDELSRERFLEWRRERLNIGSGPFYAILQDMSKQGNSCRIDFCAPVPRELFCSTCGLLSKTIPGGRCAVLRVPVGLSSFRQCAGFLLSDWLHCSGEQRRNFPLFLKLDTEIPETMDMYLPLIGS
jgi:AraC family transcriptional regulator